jgi:hypothetical protein
MEDIKNIVNSYTDIWSNDIVSNLNSMIENGRKREIEKEIKTIKKIIEHVCMNPVKYFEKENQLYGYDIAYEQKVNTVYDPVEKMRYRTFLRITQKSINYYKEDREKIANYFNKFNFNDMKFSYETKIIGIIKLTEKLEPMIENQE